MKLTASPKTFWQTTFALTFLVNLTILIWSISRWIELKVVMWRSIWAVPLILYLAVLGGCIFLFFKMQKGGAEKLVAALELNPLKGVRARIVGATLFAGFLWAIPWLKFTLHAGEVVKKSTQDPVLTTIVFYWAVWWLVLLAAAALKVALKTSWPGGFAAALVILGIAYQLFILAQDVSAYPFSLGWSEASRFYYGSLYFAPAIYGKAVPLSALHPSRYFLQSLAFLLPGSGLEFSRLWQVMLWVGLTGAAAIAITRRTISTARQRGLHWLVAGWLFLFLLRVGVYYHLEVMVIIPLLFVSAKHPWRSLAAVMVASAWAGVSRVNWFPMPGLLAAAMYLVETPLHHEDTKSPRENKKLHGSPHCGASVVSSWLSYLTLPLIWVFAGLLTALCAQALYIPLSGNAGNAAAFASSFSSDLLWNRLWPNDSFPLGVLPAILIVSGPLLLVLLRSPLGNLHPSRWAGLLVALIVLFIGGLIVSVKIGGGGDLHNMDAYAVFVSLLATYCVGSKVHLPVHPATFSQNKTETSENESGRKWGMWPVTAIALLIPLIFLIPALSPFPQFNDKSNQATLTQLKTLTEQAGKKGPVLFINERHLVTFKQIRVGLVPDYEAVTLMEMAMSNNQPYLQQFYADLKNHRFAAIVSGKQNVGMKEEGSFSDESNVWNTRVSPYILCYYESAAELEADESKIEFYVPRTTPGICP